jgi:hypothetical protein
MHSQSRRLHTYLSSLTIQVDIAGFVVSGITCSKCERWTKIGRVCSRCSEPLEDHLEVDIESTLAVAGGAVGGLAVGLTIASYLFLGLLTLL